MSHTTCDCTQAARDAETDIWPNPSAGQLLAAAIAKAADGMGLTSSLLARPGPSEPADASEALRDVPPAERPSEALPRPIDPEDVRVGMVVDIIDRARIRRVDDQRAWISDDEYTMLRRDGRSLCTVASTPRTFDKATNEWKDGETLFMRCSIWREAAENVAESLTRGTRVIVTGRLKSRSYEKDGQQRTAYELDVEEVGPSLRYARANVALATTGEDQ